MVTHKEIAVELKLPGLTRKISACCILWWPNAKQMFDSRYFSTVEKDTAKKKGGMLEPCKFKSEFCYRKGNNLLKSLLSKAHYLRYKI